MKKLALGERVTIVISRNEANFDRACDEAFQRALGDFGIDEDGHINAVAGADRSESTLIVAFTHYERTASMGGHSHCYLFSAFVSGADDEPA